MPHTPPAAIVIAGLPAFDSNYLWVLHNDCNAWAVDPGDADVVLEYLNQHRLTLAGILVTHHHSDHVGGVLALRQRFPAASVIGPVSENIAGIDLDASDGAVFDLHGLSPVNQPITAQCLAVPGHTRGHVAYYLAPCAELGNTPRLFCGDVMFAAGCGRLFEGTPEHMHASLHRLLQYPDHTLTYCAHEYTASNLIFAQAVEPSNTAITERAKQVTDLRAAGLPTVPFALGEERLSNVFLRTQSTEVAAKASAYAGLPLSASVDVFAALRAWKNQF